jgi:hypothetical protein
MLVIFCLMAAVSLPLGCLAKEKSMPTGSSAASTPAPAATAKSESLAATSTAGAAADTSQQFDVDNLPAVIAVNPMTMERNTADMQPRLNYLRITGLKVAADGKTVEFTIENNFERTNAKAIRLGGLMLAGMARYDYDNGAELHNCILLREKRVVLEKGATTFRTDPAAYPQVTKVEKLQFFITPPKESVISSVASLGPAAGAQHANTSQTFAATALPEMIVIDQSTVEQHARQKDPRLGYLKITDLRIAEDGRTVEFNIENTFDRQKSEEPIHIGGLMITGASRFEYDGGAELHSSVLFDEKRLAIQKGVNSFKTNPELYPNVAKIETLQFYITPE